MFYILFSPIRKDINADAYTSAPLLSTMNVYRRQYSHYSVLMDLHGYAMSLRVKTRGGHPHTRLGDRYSYIARLDEHYYPESEKTRVGRNQCARIRSRKL